MKYISENQPENNEGTKVKTETAAVSEKIEAEAAIAGTIAQEYVKAMKVNRRFLYEDKGKREPNAKYYVGNDGTVTAVYSGKAVHYFDEQTKEIKEVDNSLSDSGEFFETQANTFQTRFEKRSLTGGLFGVTKGKCRVELKSQDLAKNCRCDADNCTCEESNAAESKLLFKEVAKDVDIQYVVDSDRVKENIIVKAKGEKYEYDFSLALENLDVGVSADGKTLQLKDRETGEVKFYIPAPFMSDAAGNFSDLVYYEITEQEENTLHLKVVADGDWIDAKERVFPVTVDPQIVSSDSAVITYKYYEQVEKDHSNGPYLAWEEKSVSPSMVNVDSTHKLVLTIDKSSFTIPMKSVSSAKVKITSIYGYHGFVNGEEHSFSHIDEIDITSQFKSSQTKVQLEFTNQNGYINVFDLSGSLAPQLMVEYVENDLEAAKKKINLSGKVSCELDVGSGMLSTMFCDVKTGGTALPLQIAHVHIKSNDKLCCGEDWRLNLHQKLEKSGEDYFYTDSVGQKHAVSEVYYYVEGGTRQTLEKSEVTAESDGTLTYTAGGNTYEVTRELRTNSGLRLVTRLDGLKNVAYIEQRQDEEKQLEEYVETYKKSLEEFRLVDLSTGAQLSVTIDVSSVDSLNTFIGYSTDNYIAMARSEAVQYESLLINRDSTQSSYSSDDFPTENKTVSKEELLKQLNNIKSQIELIKSGAEEKREQVKKLYTEYQSKSEELKALRRALPVSYAVDDENGKILCFNAYGKLCAVTDRYENYITVEWGDVQTSGGTAEVVTCVYEGENRTTFEYGYAGRLSAIAASSGERTEYSYTSGGALSAANFSDGSILRFDYTNGEIKAVRGNDHTLTTLAYAENGYALQTITCQSTVTAVTDASEPVSPTAMSGTIPTSGNAVSLITVVYGADYTAVTSDGKSEYILFDGNKKLLGRYVNNNGKIDDVTLCARMERAYQFTVRLKKTADMLNPSASTSSEISGSLGKKLPVISSLPGITEEYSTYGEADWESVTLDSFNRPTRATTNWRYAGTSSEGKNIFVYTVTNWKYAASNPSYPCVKKTTTVYTNLEGNEKTTNAETKVYVEKYSYCEHGNLVKTESYVEGEEGTSGVKVTERVCDGKGNVVKEFTYNTLDSSTKFYTENEYTENGKVSAELDETGESKTVLEYAENTDRVVREKYPNGSKFGYGYDASGKVTAITQSTDDGEENSTNVKYTLNCPTRLTSGNNLVYYEYDHKRRLTKVTANGTETSYAYAGSAYDGTESVSSPAISIGGKTFSSKKADKKTVTRGAYVWEEYTDKQGNPIYSRIGTAVQCANNYNANGTVSSSGDKVTGSVKTYSYQEKTEKATKAVITAGTNVSVLTEEYTYNAHGELGSRTLTGAVTQSYGYSYKATAGREIDCVTLPNGLKAYPMSDVNGRNRGKELYSGENKIYGEYIYYRKVGDHATTMPSSVYYGINGVISDNIRYKYDGMGNIVAVYENGRLSVKYAYDGIGRLIREDNRKRNQTYLYSYDNCGNILTKRSTAYTRKKEEEIAEYTEEKQYSYAGDRLTTYNGTAIAYDTYGNPTSYKGNTLTWQYGRRLTKYGTTTFTYDGYGRRLTKGGTVFTYDANGNLLKQTDGTNTLEYIYDTNGLSGFKCNGTNYLYRKNAQGDITQILDTAGMVVAKYVYDAWGNCTVENVSGTVGTLNPFRYRSYYFDTETNLYFLQTRYYDPEVGRFISQDDVSYLDPEHINGLNLYAYCGDNPVMNVDPNGTNWWTDFWNSVAGKVVGTILVVAAVVALSILTAGIGTAVTGALGGGLLASILGGAVGGAVSGAIMGAGLSIVTQGICKGYANIDGVQVLTETIYSATAGLIAGGIFGGIKHVLSASKIANGLSGLNNAEKAFNNAQSALQKTPMAVQGGVMSTERVAAQLAYDLASANYNYVKSVYTILKLASSGLYWLLENGLSYGIGLIPSYFGG